MNHYWILQGFQKSVLKEANFCHNTYVAEVIDLDYSGKEPKVENVIAAVDCGVVVNPDSARNMGEGGIIDGIGNAFYGSLSFENGVPSSNNFDGYRMIRLREAPKHIDIHFVENNEDPTGLGEPLFPPVFAGLSNALYKATVKRSYDQPLLPNQSILG